MQKTVIKTFAIFLAVCFGVGLFTFPVMSAPSSAAPAKFKKGICALKKNVTITASLNGSKKHKIRFTEVIKSSHSDFRLYIDGKCEYKYKALGCKVSLLKINNSTTLVFVSTSTDNDYSLETKLYRYSNGKLNLCKDFGINDPEEGVGSMPIPKSAGRNQFTVRWSMPNTSIGWFDINVGYHFKNNKVVKKSNTYSVILPMGYTTWKKNNWGTASRAFKTYTKAGGTKQSFVIKKNEKIRVLKVKFKNNNLYFQVQNKKGKKGWYKNKMNGQGYFKEAHFAA